MVISFNLLVDKIQQETFYLVLCMLLRHVEYDLIIIYNLGPNQQVPDQLIVIFAP